MKKFRDFESAREFVRALGLKGDKEWKEYRKSDEMPDDIPSNPNTTYKKDFKGMGDFLGTGNVAPKTGYRSFTEAREFVRSLELKNNNEWLEYCKSGNKPNNIPTNPHRSYKKDFKGLGDFLGTGSIAPKDRVYRLFTEARNFVQKLKLKNQTEWREYAKSGNKPNNIPVNPNTTYKKDFKGMGDWLGTGNVASFNKKYRSFTEAREFVKSLGLKSGKEWNEYCKSGNKPDNIPFAPRHTYKKDFKTMGDWLGNGRTRNFRSFEEAREFVKSLGLKSYSKEWKEYCKSGDKPDDISPAPDHIYKNKGWISWGDFLGTGRVADQNKVYRSLESAKEFVQKLGLKNHEDWKAYCKSGNKPDDIPSAPWSTYKEWKKK